MTRQGGVGARGGHVRSVEEARDLQTASPVLDRWRLVMEEQIARTLLATGRFHVDDLDDLNLPPAAFEVRGTLVNSVRRRGLMESTNVYRKVAHAAANGRKAPIYRITSKGRQELSKLVGVGSGGDRCPVRSGLSTALPVRESLANASTVDPGESNGGRGTPGPADHVVSSPDPLQLGIPESPRLFDYDRPEAA
jgi:hypothetical protein